MLKFSDNNEINILVELHCIIYYIKKIKTGKEEKDGEDIKIEIHEFKKITTRRN